MTWLVDPVRHEPLPAMSDEDVKKTLRDNGYEEKKPTASYQGFTDSKGRTMTYEEGVTKAADCIMHETHVVEELVRDALSPTDILEWLIYPDTGEFAE